MPSLPRRHFPCLGSHGPLYYGTVVGRYVSDCPLEGEDVTAGGVLFTEASLVWSRVVQSRSLINASRMNKC